MDINIFLGSFGTLTKMDRNISIILCLQNYLGIKQKL